MVFQTSFKSFASLALLVLLGFLLSEGVQAQTLRVEAQSAVPGQYLVKYKVPQANTRQIRSQLNARLLKSLPLTGAELIQSDALNEQYAKELLASGQAEYIEPNYRVSIVGTPSDTRFSEQWGMSNNGALGGTADVDIDAPEAWNVTTGNAQVVVGVVDTGIDYRHPDLSSNMWRNSGEIPNNGIDDDGNGIIDDIYGYNALAQNGDPLDDNNHGTHCAGVIGAVSNNNSGVAGINWNVRLMALKFLDSGGSGTMDSAISAIQYAVNMKNRGVNIRVLSNSWGGSAFSQALQDAISQAESAGILFVAAAGNNGTDNDVNPQYPAAYDNANIIAVAAIDRAGNLASFSNYGQTTVHVAAPGKDILSTVRDGGYAVYSGTSMATPHVSGIAALLAGKETNLSASQLKERILGTVKPLSSLNGLLVAPGMADAFNSLTSAFTPLPPGPAPVQYATNTPTFDFDSSYGTKVLIADDGYVIQDLGFNFRFYGVDYHRVVVSANGRVLPIPDGAGVPGGADYSNRLFPGINVYADDLSPTPASVSPTGGVWFKSENGTATFTWDVVSYAARTSTDPGAQLLIQARITADGRILFRYKDTDTNEANFRFGKSATVGIAPTSGGVGEKVLISNNNENQALLGSGRALLFSFQTKNAVSDYDGDGTSDIAVWRPSIGMWFILPSSTGFSYEKHFWRQLGLAGDIPVPGKYDADIRTDMAVFRPTTGEWFFRYSSQGFDGAYVRIQWGLKGDIPVPGDYDGDGRTDIAVYRPKDGNYYVLKSSGSFNRTLALQGNSSALMKVYVAGKNNYPVVADFTGEGKDSFLTVFNFTRFWSLRNSNGKLIYSLPWGIPGDTPLGCQFNRQVDNVADRVMVRTQADGQEIWYTVYSNGLGNVESFGSITDTPLCRQFAGDENDDKTVFRNWTGEWFVQPSGTKSVLRYSFGLPGDMPV